MSDIQTLEFDARETGIKFRVRLLKEDNPEVVDQILKSLPIESMLGHVVISGEAIWLPTRIVHLGATNMVTRHPGAVYLYAPGQSICMTYGAITESALVNKFGEVFEEDMDALRSLGQVVWNKTIAEPRKQIVGITIRAAS